MYLIQFINNIIVTELGLYECEMYGCHCIKLIPIGETCIFHCRKVYFGALKCVYYYQTLICSLQYLGDQL